MRSRAWNRFAAANAVLIAIVVPTVGRSAELSGVAMPGSIVVSGKTLTLNGIGLRKKAIIKVYVGGLYLETRSHDPAAILAADAPRAVRMQFLRNVGHERLAGAFREGFRDNAPTFVERRKADVDRCVAMLPDIKTGDVLTVAYVPGTGATLTLGGRLLGTIEGREFAEALFLIWLGPKPPSAELKKGLLG
ncbi:MAG: hypothetical protein E6K78_00730 [Candidatus Eisenbacteria bacterium]|uniref:Chalcone isomerase domain-containing protein n=1 Tax=Eiseniibacteriota bacterium TaxID=2212470 RepID=A0A538TY18_UNCEI|nr:MAG: hypothetical protein E6K78_00730 [Candidatus Eisenbacteria bacterium]